MIENPVETAGMARAGHLLGLLWLREIDRSWAAELSDPALRESLSQLGLTLPDDDDEAAINHLASTYFEELVHPTTRTPPVHSLVVENKYEGNAAGGVRKVAEALGVDQDQDASRGAPPDHLGAELTLWAELCARSPESAREFASEFLAWAPGWCRRHGSAVPGFYGRLFTVTADFVAAILQDAPNGDGERES